MRISGLCKPLLLQAQQPTALTPDARWRWGFGFRVEGLGFGV